MIVKINPRDVVSIPTDYDFSKGRACRYEVIAELGVDADEAFDKPVQETANTPAPVEAPNTVTSYSSSNYSWPKV